MINWHTFSLDCINYVARDIAIQHIPFIRDYDERMKQLNLKTQEFHPEACRMIDAMTNLELLNLISEVMGVKIKK